MLCASNFAVNIVFVLYTSFDKISDCTDYNSIVICFMMDFYDILQSASNSAFYTGLFNRLIAALISCSMYFLIILSCNVFQDRYNPVSMGLSQWVRSASLG